MKTYCHVLEGNIKFHMYTITQSTTTTTYLVCDVLFLDWSPAIRLYQRGVSYHIPIIIH